MNPGDEKAAPSMQKRAWPSAGPARMCFGCQMGSEGSSVGGAMSTAGGSLPGMSLAFALMAAINGSTGSRAILTFGL